MFAATFWVGISFLIFVIVLVYKKVPFIINKHLDDKIKEIKNKVDESEKLKNESEKLLSSYQSKYDSSKKECDLILENAKKLAENETKDLTDKFNTSLKNREKNLEEKLTNYKNQAIKEMQVYATNIAIETTKVVFDKYVGKEKKEELIYSSIKKSINKINS